MIRGVVGDTLMVHFRNNTPAQMLSIHPHGVFYNTDSEGAPYNDGTGGADKIDDEVPPGGTHTSGRYRGARAPAPTIPVRSPGRTIRMSMRRRTPTRG